MEAVVRGEAANSNQVKRYLLRIHGNVCMSGSCAWDFNKLSVNVELEHKDGNSDNNALENCLLLCPNCHSLTPTYKNRNRGNGRYIRRQRYAEGKSF
jgi:5-methylcytosine-specific restriction endonuclease McrA